MHSPCQRRRSVDGTSGSDGSDEDDQRVRPRRSEGGAGGGSSAFVLGGVGVTGTTAQSELRSVFRDDLLFRKINDKGDQRLVLLNLERLLDKAVCVCKLRGCW